MFKTNWLFKRSNQLYFVVFSYRSSIQKSKPSVKNNGNQDERQSYVDLNLSPETSHVLT
jgi:hypothetical protein